MNKHELTNQELVKDEVIGKALKEGKVVVIGIVDTKNPEVKTAFLAQERNDVSNAATEVQQFLLGWGSSSQIVRVAQSFKPSVANLTVGATIEGFNIQVEDSLAPFYTKRDGTPQEPRKRPNGGLTITKGGQPIYRNGQLVAGEPQHNLITNYDKLPANAPALSITAAQNAFKQTA